jgi:hypothetical protein
VQKGEVVVRALALDPGETTGYAFAQISDIIEIGYDQEEMSHDLLYAALSVWQPFEYLICEDFEYRPGKAKPNLNLYPVELIGVCKLWASWHPKTKLTFQKAAVGKSWWSDDKLKDEGLYIEGVPHGRDAARHLLHWLLFREGYSFVEGQDLVLFELEKSVPRQES